MDLRDIQTLKRAVRRDPDISDGACRLFAEIADMHALDGGCFAGDTQLGAWLGCSSRTVRRRKQELEAAGYIEADHRNGRRYLAPVADVDKTDRTDMTDKTDQMDKSDGQNCPPVDKTVRTNLSNTESIYIPPSGENTRESAGAREAEPASSDLPCPLSDLTADEIYKWITGHGNPGVQAVDWMQQIVDEGRSRDGPLPGDTELRRGFWEMIVRTWTDSETRNERQPQKLLNDFTTQLREHYADRNREDPDNIPSDPTENRLRILRAAAEGAGLA